MDQKKINELLEKGYLRVRVMFEMLGKPKEHIEETIKKYLDVVRTNTSMEIISEEFGEAIEQDDGLWSTFAEVNMMVESMDKLTWLSVNYMPSSIEIIEPASITVSNKDLGFWISDVLANLHEISLMTKGIVKKDQVMSQTLGTLMKNIILISLESGANTLSDLFRKTGIREDQLKELLTYLIDKGKVVQEEDSYKRIKKSK